MIEHQGIIIWLTGLPGSGKKTIANLLSSKLKRLGAKTEVLDGDQIRELSYGEIGFSRDERIQHIEIVSKMAMMFKKQGIITIVSVIAPYKKIRDKLLISINAIEVFVDAPLDICISRDPKGMYSKALLGEIKNFTGVDDVYEKPKRPPICLETENESPEQSCQNVYSYLLKKGYIDDLTNEIDSLYQLNKVEKILVKFPFPLLFLFKSKLRESFKLALISSFRDLLQFLKINKYNYKHKKLFIAGLPKSGTTWLRNMLGMIPGYMVKLPYDTSRSITLHDISPVVFDLIPDYSYSVIKLHTKYTPYNYKIIKKNVGKFIVLYRDLRDMCVSRYYHVLNQTKHRHHSLYNELSMDDALYHSINIVNKEYVAWVRDWHEVAILNKNIIIEVTYEDLNLNTYDTLEKILSFFHFEYHDKLINSMGATKMKKKADLKRALDIGDTKRKGRVGDWKNHFTNSHKEYFKKIAGDLLVCLGYEKDNNW